jgi:hypothetical protein
MSTKNVCDLCGEEALEGLDREMNLTTTQGHEKRLRVELLIFYRHEAFGPDLCAACREKLIQKLIGGEK